MGVERGDNREQRQALRAYENVREKDEEGASIQSIVEAAIDRSFNEEDQAQHRSIMREEMTGKDNRWKYISS